MFGELLLGEILVTWNMGITLFETKIVKYFMHVMPHSSFTLLFKIFIYFTQKNRNILLLDLMFFILLSHKKLKVKPYVVSSQNIG